MEGFISVRRVFQSLPYAIVLAVTTMIVAAIMGDAPSRRHRREVQYASDIIDLCSLSLETLCVLIFFSLILLCFVRPGPIPSRVKTTHYCAAASIPFCLAAFVYLFLTVVVVDRLQRRGDNSLILQGCMSFLSKIAIVICFLIAGFTASARRTNGDEPVGHTSRAAKMGERSFSHRDYRLGMAQAIFRRPMPWRNCSRTAVKMVLCHTFLDRPMSTPKK